MIGEVRNTIRSKMSAVYLYLCLCGNKAKMDSELKKRHIQDENDILREEFERLLSNIQDLLDNGSLVLNKTNIE